MEVTAANFEWMGSSSRKSIVDCVVRSIGLERRKRKEGRRETLRERRESEGGGKEGGRVVKARRFVLRREGDDGDGR